MLVLRYEEKQAQRNKEVHSEVRQEVPHRFCKQTASNRGTPSNRTSSWTSPCALLANRTIMKTVKVYKFDSKNFKKSGGQCELNPSDRNRDRLTTQRIETGLQARTENPLLGQVRESPERDLRPRIKCRRRHRSRQGKRTASSRANYKNNQLT